jgi:RNA-splicing ligase RtcB
LHCHRQLIAVSRGVGNKLATRHIKVAQQWCERAWIPLPEPDLAYLVEIRHTLRQIVNVKGE